MTIDSPAIPAPLAVAVPAPLWRRARLLVVLALVVATTAVFFPALTADFVDWDDDVNLLRNVGYRGLTLAHLRWMVKATVMGHYIPLTWLTLGFDYGLWGMDARGYHLTNLVLHAGVAITFFAVALRLLRRATTLGDGPRLIGAAVAALFFAVHPLRAESVAWITERRDVLSGLFFLLTILGYLAAQDARGRRRRLLLAAALAAYIAAVLSKSIVMGLPLILVVLDVYPLRRLQLGRRMWKTSRDVLLEKVPYLAIGIACAATSYVVVKTYTQLTTLEHFGVSGRVAMVFYTLWFYVTRTFVPVALSPLYELPRSVSVLQPRFALVAVVVTLITLALIGLRRRWPAGLAAWACYAIVLAPVSGVVHAGLQLAHDRYSYLSCLGWALIIGAAAGALLESGTSTLRPAFRRLALVAVAGWIMTLGWLGFQQTRVWHDTLTLWTHAVDSDGACAVCHGNLAAYLVNHDDLGGAIAHARIAITLRPDRGRPYATLGQALVKANQPAAAIPYFEKFLEAVPGSVDISGLGLALVRAGRPAEALAPLQQSLALDPDNITVRVNYAAAFVALADRDAAMQEYRRALRDDPTSAPARYGLGWALLRFGDLAGARREQRVLELLDASLAAQLASEIRSATARPS